MDKQTLGNRRNPTGNLFSNELYLTNTHTHTQTQTHTYKYIYSYNWVALTWLGCCLGWHSPRLPQRWISPPKRVAFIIAFFFCWFKRPHTYLRCVLVCVCVLILRGCSRFSWCFFSCSPHPPIGTKGLAFNSLMRVSVGVCVCVRS